MKKITALFFISLLLAGCTAFSNKHIIPFQGMIESNGNTVSFTKNATGDYDVLREIFFRACPHRTSTKDTGYHEKYLKQAAANPKLEEMVSTNVIEIRKRKGFCEGQEVQQ